MNARTLSLLSGALLLLGTGCGTNPLGPTARAIAVAGQVVLVHAGASTPLVPKKPTSVVVGDALETGPKSEAIVEVAGYVSYVRESSRLAYLGAPAPGEGPVKVQLMRGLATFLVPRAESRDYRFEAAAGTVIAAVRGTQFSIEAPEAGPVVVTVLDGSVELLSSGARATIASVAAGERVTVPGLEGKPFDKKTLSLVERAEEDKKRAAASIVIEALLDGIDLGTH